MRWRGSDNSTEVNLAPTPAASVGGVARAVPAGSRSRGWTLELTREKANLLWLIALAVAGVYLVVYVARFSQNLTGIMWDSDYASEFVVPETVARVGTAGHTVIASSGQWLGLLFGLLTAKLPLHRELWSVLPTLMFLAAALLVGWSVAQVSNRRAAVLSVLLGVIAAPQAWSFLMAPGAHNTVYTCTALLGAYLIWLTRARGRSRLASWAVPPLAGVVAGLCLASDLLLAATALIPLAFTAVVASLAHNRRSSVLALSALVTAAVAVPVSKLMTSIMHSEGFLTLVTPAKAVPVSELPERARLLFDGLKMLFNGSLGPAVPDRLHDTVGIVSVFVMSAALLALLAFGVYTGARFVWSNLRRAPEPTPAQMARTLHVVYWVASAGSACGAFWIAAETGGGTDLHPSYYATVILSVAATIPLLLSSSGALARWLIPLGASIFFAASLVRLTDSYINLSPVSASTAPAILKAAEDNHARYGYGGYGEASDLTWYSHGRVTSRPVMECSNPAGVGICPFYMESVPSWYVPQQRRTFLIVSSQELWVSRLPSGLGRPLASYTFGTVSMYVYPYDIASRLGPQQD